MAGGVHKIVLNPIATRPSLRLTNMRHNNNLFQKDNPV